MIPRGFPDSSSASQTSVAALGADHHLEAVLARVARPADHRIETVQEPSHRQVIVANGLEWLIEEGLERLERPRTLDGDHRRIGRPIPHRPGVIRAMPLELLDDLRPVRCVADDQVGHRLAVNEDIVDHPAPIVGHQAILDLTVRETRDFVGRDAFQPRQHRRAVESQLTHVADVEQTHALTHRQVLLDDRRVLHGHRPSAEFHQAAAVRLMPLVQWCKKERVGR